MAKWSRHRSYKAGIARSNRVASTGVNMEWTANPRADGRMEWNCEHGVGHGQHVHGCDGCCYEEDYPGELDCPLCGGKLRAQNPIIPIYGITADGVTKYVVTYRCKCGSKFLVTYPL